MWGSILGGDVLIGVSALLYCLLLFCESEVMVVVLFYQVSFCDVIMKDVWANEREVKGWAKFMEWKYPSVEVKITSQKAFRTAGAIEVAASL